MDSKTHFDKQASTYHKARYSPTLQVAGEYLALCLKGKHTIAHGERETRNDGRIRMANNELRVTCRSHENRFVVHGHSLRSSTAIRLESNLKRRFGQLHDVWVDHDVPWQLTVKFQPSPEFKRADEYERRETYHHMVGYVLQGIGQNSIKPNITFH